MADDLSSLSGFSGKVRLFPLPNLVLFPHVVQPLHVFEERYREMTADALEGDRLIAVALLREGSEAESESRAAIHPVACLGRIVADQMLDDGRYLLLLRGLSRVRIREELATDRSYRSARVDLMPDAMTLAAGEASVMRRRLADLILPRLTGAADSQQQLRELFEGEMPLGALCDCLGFQLPLALPRRQELLEQPDVGARARALVAAIEELLPPGALAEQRKFPPDFSLN
jgi:Lon protease-like protein